MSNPPQIWTGPVEACDICDVALGTPSDMEFVDGRLCYGTWANMCNSCHQELGVGIGPGKGQRYQLEDIGGQMAWIKKEG